MAPVVISAESLAASDSPIIGIDLGTTYSLAAYMTGAGPKVVRDAGGDARVPSVLVFGPDGSVEVVAIPTVPMREDLQEIIDWQQK